MDDQAPSSAPKRRWLRFALWTAATPQFSLRLLLLAMLCVGAILAYQLDWIRQRREFLQRPHCLPFSRLSGVLWQPRDHAPATASAGAGVA
jgi:hypothetical protein